MNPLHNNPWPLCGIRILTNTALTEACQDFRRCRSPSRALRRWKKRGIKGNIIFERPSRKIFHLAMENAIVCHPIMYHEVRKKLNEA